MKKQQIRILLVEENSSYAQMVQKMLDEDTNAVYELVHWKTLGTALLYMLDNHVDVIIFDSVFSNGKGLNEFKIMHRASKEIPIIILTGRQDDEMAANVIRYGAQDYLYREYVDCTLLKRSIQYAVEEAQTEQALMRH